MTTERESTLDLEKCITSKLWYTAEVTLSTKLSRNINEFLEKDQGLDLQRLVNENFDNDNRKEFQWIVTKLLQTVANNTEYKEDVYYLQRELKMIQFLTVLKMVNENVPIEVQQELSALYHSVNSAKLNLQTTVPTVSESTFQFLEEHLWKRPFLICWVIKKLLCIWPPTFSETDTKLQNLYFRVLRGIFEEKADLDYRIPRNHLAVALSILSNLEITEDKESELLSWLYPLLLKTRSNDHIEFAFFARKDIRFIRSWHIFVDKALSRCEPIETLNDAFNVTKAIILSSTTDSAILNAKELCIRMIQRNTHWLLDILEICYILTINAEDIALSGVLMCPLLKDLWPVVMLQFFCNHPSEEIVSDKTLRKSVTAVDTLELLLDKCDPEIWYDPTLSTLKRSLQNCITIVKWILECKREAFEQINAGMESFEEPTSLKHIFSLLCERSVLSVLKSTVSIHYQNFHDIQMLLESCDQSTRVFQLYCCMLCALKAIISSEQNYAKNLEEITNDFAELESIFDELPLNLRLETIENVFTLLFLRLEHFDATNDDEIEDARNKFNCDTGFLCNKYTVREILHNLKDLVEGTVGETRSRKTDPEMLEKLLYLEKCVNEAIWRLKILTGEEFVRRVGSSENIGSKSASEEQHSYPLNEELRFSNRLKERSLFYNSDDTSSEEMDPKSSDVELSSEGGSQSNPNSGKRKRRLHSHNSNPEGPSGSTRGTSDGESIINFMLASKESFVSYCLTNGQYDRALQAIEMFDMKNTHLDGETRFSNALQGFRQEMRIQTDNPAGTVGSDKKLHSATLENIRQAVKVGIQSSRSTGHLATLLATEETNMRLMSSNAMSSKEILALAVSDLALTMGFNHQTSTNLCDAAVNYSEACESLKKSAHSAFLSRIYQLLYGSKPETSVMEILTNVGVPLTVEKWKERNYFWTELTKLLDNFEKSQTSGFQDEEGAIVSKQTLQDIVKVCNVKETYLNKIVLYLEMLGTIIPETQGEKEFRTETEILKGSINSYFAYQIFDMNIEPENLEAVANKLQVNLTYSVLASCCPKMKFPKPKGHHYRSDYWGCIILNKDVDETMDYCTQEPNKYIADILWELLGALKYLFSEKSLITHDDLKGISKQPEIEEILCKTHRLSTLDLSNLSDGDETLTFMLNTYNVMFLHGLLVVWENNPPTNDARHTLSLMTMGYNIGGLGFVTLANLRSKLLGKSCEETQGYFSRIEDLNEPAWEDLDLTEDPRVIFAMANEFSTTPVVTIYAAESFNEDLNNAAKDYLDFYVKSKDDCNNTTVENPQEEIAIQLPDLVEKYQKLAMAMNDSEKLGCKKEGDAFFSVDEYLKVSRQKVEKVSLEFTEPTFAYCIKLEYTEGKIPCVEKDEEEDDESLWFEKTVRPRLLQYLEGHCWLLSYLVQRFHVESPTISDNSCENLKCTACLENLLSSKWAIALKSLFKGNLILAGMHDNVPPDGLWTYLGEVARKKKWKTCLDILFALPDYLLINNAEMQCLRDNVLSSLISNRKNLAESEILRYLYQIQDIFVVARTLLKNINKWSNKVCEDALSYALQHKNKDKLTSYCIQKLKEALCRVTVFHKMLPYCSDRADIKDATWYDVVYCTKRMDPMHIINSLLEADKFELCLEWLEFQAFSSELPSLVSEDLLIGLLNNENQDFRQTLKFLNAIPPNQSMKMCKNALKQVDTVPSMKFIVEYLLDNCEASKQMEYRRTLVGVEILNQLDAKERKLYNHLIKEPLLMLEQLLMNGKFETIQRILGSIQELLERTDVTAESFDRIVRFYAGKSLDFRVALQSDGTESKSKEVQQSHGDSEGEFVMPAFTPSRDEWVPNHAARKCSCCKIVIFSMFNRRHHCRRCGRVVCAMCSQQRMRVFGYPKSVLVRVCDDCKRFSQMQNAQGAVSTPSSETFEYWRLSSDKIHNETVRQEFSFEYAPSTSLCLAILNLHSDHKAYTSFLLDRCDEMKKLVQPVNGGKVNLEVDHSLIIKMIRSLLVAAKVKCSKLGLNTGLTHCDRFLSQVDLISTLVQSDCLALIPTDNLDEHALRKLRDLLTEREQWTLALDVSTKSGLDTQGVWAAWGKACLKVGCYVQAREKFLHCMDKVLCEDFEDWVILPEPKDCPDEAGEAASSWKSKFPTSSSERSRKSGESSPARKKPEIAKNRPIKDPPLLTEIVQIIEGLRVAAHAGAAGLYHAKVPGAQEILSTLNSLKSIAQDQYSVFQAFRGNANVYYQENLYYLLAYGSYSSILEFFIDHGELEKCLMYILENDVGEELFFNNVYLKCLKTGTIEKLCKAIRKIDNSLQLWRKYLAYTCKILEKQQHMHTLYEMQLFMKDYVRASMTCVRFYLSKAATYKDLCSRTHLLTRAQEHLEAELQVENLGRRRKKSVGSQQSAQSNLTMEMEPSEIDKHINTISRQMEIAKFLQEAENEGRPVNHIITRFPGMESDRVKLPTLFGNHQERCHLAALAILCGRNVEEGFGIAFRIMQDYNLRPLKVYYLAGHVLALENKISSIEQLIKCCRSSGAPCSHIISDEVLAHCVRLSLNQPRSESHTGTKYNADTLIKLIVDVDLKITAYIESRQLKAAYLLAVKHSKAQDIRRILKEADRLGQNSIKTICIKWLQQNQES